MKASPIFHCSLFGLCSILLLAACITQQVMPTATAPSAPTGTARPQLAPTETPSASPLALPELTATDTSAGSQLTSPCLFLVQAKTRDSGQLQVVYASDCVSEFDATPKKLWLWVEGQPQGTPLPLPRDAVEPYLSDDHNWILFRRDVDELVKEIWVIGSDGQNENKLATISFAEVGARYPGSLDIAMEYGWVGASNRMVYHTYPQYDLESGASDELVLVDVETGAIHPLAPPGEVSAFASTPDGSQIAAATSDELRLINAPSWEVQFTLPLATGMASPGMMQYSPDGRYLVIFTQGGLAVVDAAQGTYRILPIEFILWGAGDTPLAKPTIYWATDETFFMATLHSETRELFEGNIQIWQVDAAKANAQMLQQLVGFYPSVILAPKSERKHLLYQKVQPDNPALRELYILDLATGVHRLYAEGEIGQTTWSPDSTHFLFSRSEPLAGTEYFTDRLYLGHVEREPRPLEEVSGFLQWAGSERFLTMQRTGDGVDELRLHALDGESVLVGSSALANR